MYRQESKVKKASLSRRQFCNGVIITSAGLVLAKPLQAYSASQQGRLVEYPPYRIVGAECVMPGYSLYFDYPTAKDPAVLTRSCEGEFQAFSRKCSHAGCSVEFDVTRKCLQCPCHKGTYDVRAGEVMLGPPRKPLESIVLQIRAGGQVWAVGKIVGRATDNIV